MRDEQAGMFFAIMFEGGGKRRANEASEHNRREDFSVVPVLGA